MTLKEFSNEFDILYNNIMSNQAPGLDEYEKSVFLTKAQDELIKNYFNAKGNKYQEGLDDSEKRQIDFSNLIRVEEIPPQSILPPYTKFDDRSKSFLMPANILFILNESAQMIIDDEVIKLTIIPLNYKEYTRLMSKPFKYPLKGKGWRLNQSLPFSSKSVAEIITPVNSRTLTYKIRYVKKPNPIILTNLEEIAPDLSIEEINTKSECELSESLHIEILQRAVELAKSAYLGDLKSTIELGQRTE